eukprot:TRINITY_DN145_c0_g1_i4.p1 TRINITY_DN145_c0_g1~~TRINITY_DN145_c0_g1_i4.p1  ORF type:complete len:163 (-),score=25.59 TRINITY_DN145_c0_g1_i4:47-535(-)
MDCDEDVAKLYLHKTSYRYDKAVRRYQRTQKKQQDPWSQVASDSESGVQFFSPEDDTPDSVVSSFTRTLFGRSGPTATPSQSIQAPGGARRGGRELSMAHTWTPKSQLRLNDTEAENEDERVPFNMTPKASYGNLTNSGYGRRESQRTNQDTDEVYTELYGL